ncbi:MAG: PilZ domain-containing protein [Thermodesulfobacteriota bacterium]
MDEKRTHAREGLSEHITCELSSWRGKLEAFFVKAVNVSKDGACIVAERTREPGSVVSLKVPFEGAGIGINFPGLAEVRWTAPAGEGGGFRMGLRFLA